MAKKTKPPKGGLTRGKAVTIGILSVVLLVVIVTQFSGGKKSVARAPRQRRGDTEASTPVGSRASSIPNSKSKPAERPWPKFDVTRVVASNPFMLPDEMRESREAAKNLTANTQGSEAGETLGAMEDADIREMRRRQSEFMASLRARGVDMILRSPRGSVARIGDLSLRLGDIHEGLRVAEIGPEGVVFLPTDVGDVIPE